MPFTSKISEVKANCSSRTRVSLYGGSEKVNILSFLFVNFCFSQFISKTPNSHFDKTFINLYENGANLSCGKILFTFIKFKILIPSQVSFKSALLGIFYEYKTGE